MDEFCIEKFLEKSFKNEKNNCINKSTINKINSLFNLNLNIIPNTILNCTKYKNRVFKLIAVI